MAITAAKIATNNTLEQFRQEFNNLQADVDGLESGTITFSTISSTSTAATTVNVLEDGSIIFEGGTDNAFETSLTVVDPTADRTITFPNETGTVHTSGGSIIIPNAGTIGSASDTDAIAIGSDGDITLTQDLELQHDGAILSFGANDEVTLSHIHNDGLLLNSDMQLQFRDSAINIRSDADGELSLRGDLEIELTSNLIDINGNVEISGTTTQTGVLTADAGIDIDNFNIDGTTIALSSGNMTLDAAGNILLDADGSQIILRDGGVTFGQFQQSGDNMLIEVATANADLIFKGNDGGSVITALTLDMSAAGEATFNADILGTSATFTTTDNSSQLRLISTDADANSGPAIDLYRNSSSPADGDSLARIYMYGENDADEKIEYGLIKATIVDASDGTEDSSMQILTFSAGSQQQRIDINAAETVFNEGSVDLDFRIESNSTANAFFVDGGANTVSFGVPVSFASTFTGGGLLTTGGNIVIPDAGTIGSASDVDAITISSSGVVTFSQTPVYSGDATFEDDIIMDSDGAILSMGEDNEITFTHVHNSGVTLTNTVNGTDDSPIVLQLKSEEDAIVANDVIASIEMAAGDSDGTDGATVAAGIHAIAEGTFSASANATKLVFTTGVSETAAASATAKMTLSSAGLLTIADDFLMKDGGTIGVASSTSAITIASSGIVTFVDDILIKDAGTIGSASDPDAIAIGADGDVTLTQDLELQHDGAILSFGANDEVTLTHVHDDGLLLNDDMQLQFRDSAINIRSDADGDLDINADDEIELNSTLIDINGNVEISGTTAQVGVSTSTAKDIFNAGVSTKNGATSAGFIEFFEDSDNGTNKVTLIGPASTADVTVTLPAATGTLTTAELAANEATALAIALG